MRRIGVTLLIFLNSLSLFSHAEEKSFFRASDYKGDYFNQNWISGNACGPAALLNSFLVGGEKHSPRISKLLKLSSKNAISEVISHFGRTPSQSLIGQQKWDPTRGVNFEDLVIMLKELDSENSKKYEVVYTTDCSLKSSQNKWLKSLKKGFPPILSLRRFVKAEDGLWRSLGGHYVSLSGVMPNKSTKKGLLVEYIDPKGGVKRTGRVDAPRFKEHQFGSLVNFPKADVFSKEAKPYKQSILVLSSFISLK